MRYLALLPLLAALRAHREVGGGRVRLAQPDVRQDIRAARAAQAPSNQAEAADVEQEVAVKTVGDVQEQVTEEAEQLRDEASKQISTVGEFFRSWFRLVFNEGLDKDFRDWDVDPERLFAKLQSPWPVTWTISAMLLACAIFMAAVACWVSREAVRSSTEHGQDVVETPRGAQTLTRTQLCAIASFRFYGGMLICTWVPYVLAEEGAHFWPGRESLFMAAGKMLLGLSMAMCPIFGYWNDQTQHSWGRRRVWFFWGVAAICAGIGLAALSSVYRWSSSLYLLATLMWTMGESAAESTVEALIPDLVKPEQWDQAATTRTVFFMAGGLVGYFFIVMTSVLVSESHHWFYVYYLAAIMFTAPPTIYMAKPRGQVRSAVEGLAGTGESSDLPAETPRSVSVLQKCYWETLNCSKNFRLLCMANVVFAMSCSGMLFILLILRDLCGVEDVVERNTHFACIAATLLLGAILVSLVLGCLGRTDHVSMAKKFMFCFAVTEILFPLCHFVSAETHHRVAYLYTVAFVKGVAYGGIYHLMQPVMWACIPDAWFRAGGGSVSRATSFVGTARAIGAGVGNVLAGFILDFSVVYLRGPRGSYPFEGYMGIFVADAYLALASIFIIHMMEPLSYKVRQVGADPDVLSQKP